MILHLLIDLLEKLFQGDNHHQGSVYVKSRAGDTSAPRLTIYGILLCVNVFFVLVDEVKQPVARAHKIRIAPLLTDTRTST